MFQFSGFAHLSMYYVFNIVGCPIRISTDQFVCANPRSFSQLITSFFASESLGIPHTPLFCLLYYYNGKWWMINGEFAFTIQNSEFTIIVFFLLFKYFLISICQWTFVKEIPIFKIPNSNLGICYFFIVICSLSLWRISESNRWPPACKAGALASWANPPFS